MRGSGASIVFVAASLLLGLALIGCGPATPDKVTTEAEAVVAARALVDLQEPLSVTLVKSGQMADIYSGAYPSFPSEEVGRAWKDKLAQQAWRVDFVGVMTHDHPQCPGVVIPNATAQLILSRSTGEVLTSVYGQPPCPPGTEIPDDD